MGCLFLCGATISVCAYAMFLCYAIYDFQDEKPAKEKNPVDLLVKDFMHSEFWLIIHICLVEIISLFAPPITSDSAYLASYISVFLIDFNLMSLLILLYIQHVYIFYFDLVANVDVSIMRQKSIMWKFLLTFFSLFLDFLFPSPDTPMAFQMLAKGAIYDR